MKKLFSYNSSYNFSVVGLHPENSVDNIICPYPNIAPNLPDKQRVLGCSLGCYQNYPHCSQKGNLNATSTAHCNDWKLVFRIGVMLSSGVMGKMQYNI